MRGKNSAGSILPNTWVTERAIEISRRRFSFTVLQAVAGDRHNADLRPSVKGENQIK